MDKRLRKVIEEYHSGIRLVLRLMDKSGMRRPKDLSEWMETRSKQQIGRFVDGTRYFIHGFGIKVDLPLGVMDFDFGPNGEIDFIDIHWAIQYVKERLNDFGFETEAEILFSFQEAIRDGQLVKSSLTGFQLTDV